MAKAQRRYKVQCWSERQFYWFDHGAPFDTKAEAREAADKLWQYKTRVVPVSEVVDG